MGEPGDLGIDLVPQALLVRAVPESLLGGFSCMFCRQGGMSVSVSSAVENGEFFAPPIADHNIPYAC